MGWSVSALLAPQRGSGQALHRMERETVRCLHPHPNPNSTFQTMLPTAGRDGKQAALVPRLTLQMWKLRSQEDIRLV